MKGERGCNDYGMLWAGERGGLGWVPMMFYLACAGVRAERTTHGLHGWLAGLIDLYICIWYGMDMLDRFGFVSDNQIHQNGKNIET